MVDNIKKEKDRRTERTKGDLKNAFIALLSEKDFNKITIADITNYAGYNRSTFYFHYYDKEHIMEEITNHTLKEMIEAMLHKAEYNIWNNNVQSKTALFSLFSFIYNHSSFFQVMLKTYNSRYFKDLMSSALNNYFFHNIKVVDSEDNQIGSDKEIYSNYMSSSIVGVIHYWLENEMNHSPQFLENELVKISETRPQKVILTGTNEKELSQISKTGKKSKDRRVIRTKGYLKQSLLSLLVEDDYNDITIQNITNHANISRVTFYQHYENKEDLLLEISDEKMNDLITSMNNYLGLNDNHFINSTVPTTITALFNYIEKNFSFFYIVFSNRTVPIIDDKLHAILNEFYKSTFSLLPHSTQMDSIDKEIFSHYITSAIIGVIKYWILSKMKYSANHIANVLTEIIQKPPHQVTKQNTTILLSEIIWES